MNNCKENQDSGVMMYLIEWLGFVIICVSIVYGLISLIEFLDTNYNDGEPLVDPNKVIESYRQGQ